jgi:hypothetical protein
MWKKASLPCLSRRIQQKVHCRRRIQRRVNLRCRSVSSEDSCSLKRVEPRGSKTTASPKSVSANSTQLNSTSPTHSLQIFNSDRTGKCVQNAGKQLLGRKWRKRDNTKMDLREIGCSNYWRSWEGEGGCSHPAPLRFGKVGRKINILNEKTDLLHSTNFKYWADYSEIKGHGFY